MKQLIRSVELNKNEPHTDRYGNVVYFIEMKDNSMYEDTLSDVHHSNNIGDGFWELFPLDYINPYSCVQYNDEYIPPEAYVAILESCDEDRVFLVSDDSGTDYIAVPTERKVFHTKYVLFSFESATKKISEAIVERLQTINLEVISTSWYMSKTVSTVYSFSSSIDAMYLVFVLEKDDDYIHDMLLSLGITLFTNDLHFNRKVYGIRVDGSTINCDSLDTLKLLSDTIRINPPKLLIPIEAFL